MAAHQGSESAGGAPRETFAARLIGLGWLAAVALVAVAYLPVLDGEFVFDDFTTIVEAPYIHKLWPPHDLLHNRRPFAIATFALNWAAGGANPAGYRLVNVMIHAAAAILLFGLVRRTLKMAAPDRFDEVRAGAIATVVAAVWAIHPLHTSAVTYVSHRYESLAGMLFLGMFYAFARGRDAPRRWPWDALAVVLCALGIASKEIVVAAPPLLLLFDRVFVGPDWRTTLRDRWPVHLCSFGTIALVLGTPLWPSQGFNLPDVSVAEYARSQLGVIPYYLRLAAWPNPLSIDYYDWPVARSIGDVALGACVVCVLLGATAFALLKRPKIGFLGAFFFAILAPTSSILPLAHELLAERRMYLPLAAVVLGVVLAADSLLRRALSRVKVLAVAIALFSLACVTVNRNGDFLSGTKLYEHETRVRPGCSRAHTWYAYHLSEAGRLDEAMREATRAIEIDPTTYRAFHVAGSVALRLGLGPLALQYAKVAIAQDPSEQAVRDLAVSALERVGDIRSAVAVLRGTLRMAPASAWHHARLAWYLATDDAVRDGAEAVEMAERAASLAGKARALRYDETLAAAYGAAGRFDEAESLARRTKERARAEAATEKIWRLDAAIEAYVAHEPYTIDWARAASPQDARAAPPEAPHGPGR